MTVKIPASVAHGPDRPRWRDWLVLFALGSIVPAFLLLAVVAGGAPLDSGEPDKYLRVSEGVLVHGALVEERRTIGLDVTDDLAQIENFPVRVVPALERLPAYPLFVAALWWLAWPGSYLWIEVVQCLLGGVFAVAMAASGLAIRVRFFWPAGLFACMWPNVQWQATMVMPEMLLVTALAVGLAGALWVPFSGRPWRAAIIAALGFGIAFMSKPQLVLLPFVLAAPLWWYFIRAGLGKARAMFLVALPVAAMAAFAGVQIARVHLAHGEWLFTTHSNDHALFFVWPCLATPLGCGDPDMRESRRALTDFRDRMAKLPPADMADLIVQNRIKGEIFRGYLLEADKVAVARAVIGSYVKLLGHTAVLSVLHRFERDVVYFSTTAGEGLQKLSNFARRIAADPLMWIWALAQLMLVATRALQAAAVVGGLRDPNLRALVTLLVVLTAAVILPAAGIGNPRYRVVAEPMLLLLTLVGADLLHRGRGLVFTV